MTGYWTSATSCMAHSIAWNDDELLPFSLCADGLYHYNGNEDYAGYTEEEIVARF